MVVSARVEAPPKSRRSVSDPACLTVKEVLGRVGDKWSVLVITLLGEQTLRFTELQRSIEGVSQRMLTLTLRQLERDGIVERVVHAVVPPRVDYSLTPLGRTLLPPLVALGQWAHEHTTDIDAARKKFEARPREARSPWLAPTTPPARRSVAARETTS